MRDGEIRAAVRHHLELVRSVDEETRFRNELGLCLGETRVDVAVINGAISGYEIKSAQDTLARFPAQVEIYGRVLDHATVVTEGRFVEQVGDFVPSWWGVWEAVEEGPGTVAIVEVRRESSNPEVDPLSVAQLLWRDEALDVLRECNRGEGLSRATRWELWDRLTELPLDELRACVRHRLRTRSEWPGG